MNRRWKLAALIVLALSIALSCTAPGRVATEPPGSEATRVAFAIQSTQLAQQIQQATQAALVPPTAAPLPPTQAPPPPPAEQPTAAALPTYTPYPTYTPPAEPTAQPAAPTEQDINALIKKSNVLIFEDIWGYMPLAGDKRVNQAVNSMGFSGGKIINDGDALGNFKSHLNSSTLWDLIIVSVEVRTGVKGEFFDYLQQHIDRKAAVIIELWYLDQINLGKISPILSQCGVSLHRNWERGPNYDVLDYSILLLDPFHPVFTTPNSGISLVTPNVYWQNDAGDLMRLSAGGDAVLLAGTHADLKSDHGVLASCMEGRTILMTFSTHDYRRDQTIPLWKNMITYTLTNHYKAAQ